MISYRPPRSPPGSYAPGMTRARRIRPASIGGLVAAVIAVFSATLIGGSPVPAAASSAPALFRTLPSETRGSAAQRAVPSSAVADATSPSMSGSVISAAQAAARADDPVLRDGRDVRRRAVR